MAMRKMPAFIRRFLEQLQGGYTGVAQDIDSVKHMLRGVQWRMDAIVNHFHIPVQPDALESIVKPPPSFINSVIRGARFGGVSPAKPAKRATKSRKRRPKKKP